MEPMTLGSPVGSSASPVSPGFTSPYLPEFLMGESTPGVSWNVNYLLRSMQIFSLKYEMILCTTAVYTFCCELFIFHWEIKNVFISYIFQLSVLDGVCHSFLS